MRINELPSFFAQELCQLYEEELDPFERRNGVWLSLLIPVVRLVSCQNNVRPSVMLPPIQLLRRKADRGFDSCFVFNLSGSDIRRYMSPCTRGMRPNVLVQLGNDVFPPLRNNALLPLRDNALAPF